MELCLFTWSLVCALLQSSAQSGFYVEVPYVHQVRNYCGPAVLAMVFDYWDRSVDQHQLASQFRPFPSQGLSGAELKQLAQQNGFDAYSFSGANEDILRHLREGRPLIVALKPSLISTFNHFVVLTGWDEQERDWILHDPSRGPYRRVSAKRFAGQWKRLKNWTLLILPQAAN